MPIVSLLERLIFILLRLESTQKPLRKPSKLNIFIVYKTKQNKTKQNKTKNKKTKKKNSKQTNKQKTLLLLSFKHVLKIC